MNNEMVSQNKYQDDSTKNCARVPVYKKEKIKETKNPSPKPPLNKESNLMAKTAIYWVGFFVVVVCLFLKKANKFNLTQFKPCNIKDNSLVSAKTEAFPHSLRSVSVFWGFFSVNFQNDPLNFML